MLYSLVLGLVLLWSRFLYSRSSFLVFFPLIVTLVSFSYTCCICRVLVVVLAPFWLSRSGCPVLVVVFAAAAAAAAIAVFFVVVFFAAVVIDVAVVPYCLLLFLLLWFFFSVLP